MLDGARIAVIVPAYNEAAHVAGVLSTIPWFVDAIWVVDDGSTDASAARARGHADPRVQVLSHPRRLGVGAALRTGYAAAFADRADVAAVMAGDGQMDPDDLSRLLFPVLSGTADYAKGNRLVHRDAARAMPLSRQAGNHVLSRLTRVATGLSVMDSQCGYTALSRKAAARIPWPDLWPGYGYPNDLLGWAALAGLRVADVPVRPVYGSEVSGVRLYHALGVVPALLLRVVLRRLRQHSAGLARNLRLSGR